MRPETQLNSYGLWCVWCAMLPSERRSTVRVNKERLKAAMEAADRAEAGASGGEDASSDDIWTSTRDCSQGVQHDERWQNH